MTTLLPDMFGIRYEEDPVPVIEPIATPLTVNEHCAMFEYPIATVCPAIHVFRNVNVPGTTTGGTTGVPMTVAAAT